MNWFNNKIVQTIIVVAVVFGLLALLHFQCHVGLGESGFRFEIVR